MARKKRIWYPGAQYHVMTRGNRRTNLFKKSEDFYEYIKILFDIKQRFPFKLYAYCLMDNHIHLQIKTQEAKLSTIMQQINTIYSRYFNQEYNLVGHTFQGRYRAELIETDAYMLETNRYIHNNPVHAKMVKSPLDYKWSSYFAFVYGRDDHLVDHEEFLQLFKDTEAYIDFIEDVQVFKKDLEIESIMEDY